MYDVLGGIAEEWKMLLLAFNEILKSILQYDGQHRGFVYPLALNYVVGPHQVVHSKCTWTRILDSLSLSKKLLDQHVLHEMWYEQLEGGHHRTLQSIEDETYCRESG